MLVSFKELLTKRHRYLREEIKPSKLLHLLKCLTNGDREVIKCEERNNGEIAAVDTLINRVKRRTDEAFFQLVTACRKTGHQHAAMLLDPRCQSK